MGNCRSDKPKYNCGIKQNARCIYYEGDLPEFSELEDCVTLEETTEEIYTNLNEIKDSIDLSKLGKECINYSEFQEDEKLKVNEVMLTFEKEICDLKNNITDSSCCIDLNKIDFKCLIDPCNNSIDTQLKLIQIMIDKICELEQRIINLENG